MRPIYFVLRDSEGTYKKLTYNEHLAVWYSLRYGWVIHPQYG